MNDTMIMEFKITIDRNQISTMVCENGKVTIIPFGGTVDSDLFSGRILPGAADIQVTNAAGIRHMCARYLFEGTDYTGKACHLFVDNNGYFERNHTPRPFEALPTFMTDSEVLKDYLHGAHFRAEGYGNERGVDIRIYDIDKKSEE
ncbi:DUF3237 family protein [Cuneatibacter sp. NSJ-177]|jgi:hypothetical protein|uniref:DUF3237 family protein n=1 Tax=Cuneatibacter sp. NSJ-177 TaxID=2931401 RepID=UPI001FD5BACD|nr:DUF3237 family protein [Cuneatibacter sp. NSJ-177]MCJ7834379.1 DUF3237 family protein [Cuneatibacter sp. NSJ-177]